MVSKNTADGFSTERFQGGVSLSKVFFQFGQRPSSETQSQIRWTGGSRLNHQRFWILSIELRPARSRKIRKPRDARALKSFHPLMSIGIVQSPNFAGFPQIEPGRQLPNKIAPTIKPSWSLLGSQQSLKFQQLLCRKRG